MSTVAGIDTDIAVMTAIAVITAVAIADTMELVLLLG
jgi:hypothetical protein